MTDKQPDSQNADRRSKLRFPIEGVARYRVSQENGVQSGRGKTVNISSSGVLFTTTEPVTVGERVEVMVEWPAELESGCPLRIVFTGTAVRAAEGFAAIRIEQYEFRTASRLHIGKDAGSQPKALPRSA